MRYLSDAALPLRRSEESLLCPNGTEYQPALLDVLYILPYTPWRLVF